MPHTVQPRPWEHIAGISTPEVVFGQAVAPVYWVPGTCKLKKSAGVRKLDRPTGTRARTRYTSAPTHVTGSVEIEIAPGREQIIMDFLSMASRRLPKTLTVHDILGDQAGFENTGIAGNSVALKCSKGEDFIATIDCLGRERTRLAVPTVIPVMTFPAPYIFEELDIQVYGGGHYDLEDVELTDDKKLKDDRTGPGTGLLRELPSDGWEVGLKLAHAFEHDELWDAGMNKVEMAVRMLFSRGGNSFTITCPRCVCDEPDIEDNMQPLELTAYASENGSVAPVTYARA